MRLACTGCPNFAIDANGAKTSQPEKVKEIYVREGTVRLKTKLSMPVPDQKDSIRAEPPPLLPSRSGEHPPKKGWSLPNWWKPMYNRNAKNIPSDVWADLMMPTDWKELLEVIQSTGSNKAAGIDGVSSDLVKLLVEDSVSQPTALLKILVILINETLATGNTPICWRKAIISMIPKRKDDGSMTNLVGEMRPISVLQEFGKISSKLLAVRMGEIILRNPKVMNKAQRAFKGWVYISMRHDCAQPS